ncbi:uncharacterized protein LOC128952859 [Oppia nitens]|uniref:uncharacterized protein LOC128952859 n=1 Tax=Oppia nitens TaxID=1686743 RepID=UPI0023DA9BE0|nr:uncharacterized protein LOC128952859 [Oppia nitens]
MVGCAITGKISAIRLISINVPKEVIIKGNATFYCNYNIETDRLYSLKWYKRISHRDTEFFSYISGPEPNIHLNGAPGVNLDVDKSSATGDVLYLYDIDLTSEGYYKCEVIADYTFQALKLDSYMTVIVPPTKPPVIEGYKQFYTIGDVVTSYCFASYSKPESTIKWFINDQEVPHYYLITGNESNSGISFTLETKHLIDGRLRLCCTAFIDSDFRFKVSSEETIIKGNESNELESVPLIIGLKSNYMLGEYIDVNCTVRQMIYETSEPRLEWLIHNQKSIAETFAVDFRFDPHIRSCIQRVREREKTENLFLKIQNHI